MPSLNKKIYIKQIPWDEKLQIINFKKLKTADFIYCILFMQGLREKNGFLDITIFCEKKSKIHY